MNSVVRQLVFVPVLRRRSPVLLVFWLLRRAVRLLVVLVSREVEHGVDGLRTLSGARTPKCMRVGRALRVP
jgi:hypothetical protein